jgi:hypothetical protein
MRSEALLSRPTTYSQKLETGPKHPPEILLPPFLTTFSKSKKKENREIRKTKIKKMFFWHFCLLISQVECGKGRGSRRKQKEEKIEKVKILASLPEDDKYLFRKRLKKDTFKKVFAPYVGVYIILIFENHKIAYFSRFKYYNQKENLTLEFKYFCYSSIHIKFIYQK